MFALHLHGFTLIWLSALFPVASLALRTIAWAGAHPTLDAIDVVISALEALGIGWYSPRHFEPFGDCRRGAGSDRRRCS